MWLVVFGSGALLLHRVEVPARWTAALAKAPQPWVPYALYFLLVALLRLAIRDSRLRPLRRKAKALASQPAPAPLSPADFGMGVGKGVAAVMLGGDFLGALLAGLDLVVKWLGGSGVGSRRRIPAAIKQAMNAAATNTLDQQLDLERDSQVALNRSADFKEGVAAFLAKRPANFTGR